MCFTEEVLITLIGFTKVHIEFSWYYTKTRQALNPGDDHLMGQNKNDLTSPIGK